jgi:two-component system cell cycle sensor histidine kinase/response regulator CckA
MPKSTVMIVEDASNGLAIQKRLIAENCSEYEVISLGSSEEALDLAESRAIAGTVIDVHVEGADGLDVCRRLKSNLHTAQIPIMLVSKHDSSTDVRIRGLESGADDFVTLPIEDAEFVSRIRLLLKGKRLEDKQREPSKRVDETAKSDVGALQLGEQEYRRLLEIFPDMVVVCRNGKITFVNQAGKKLLRAQKEGEIIGIPAIEITHPDNRPQMEKMLAECLGKKTSISFTEMQINAFDGCAIDVEIAAVPFVDGGRQSVELVIRDISLRKQFSETARQSHRLEAVGRLAGGVAHDFNNVLTTIRGYSDLVLDRLNREDPLWEDVQEIRAATDRAAALTRQLLAFSRRQVLEPRPLDLNSVVRDMERMLNRIIGEDIDLITDLEAGLAMIKADRSQIEQVVMNLAVNARDAIHDGGGLTIRTRNTTLKADDIIRQNLDLDAGEYVLLEVIDTGVGMSRETMFHIFEPFFTTKAKDKGTGLGLSMVYGTVKQSHGDISVASAPSEGATFSIYLPRMTMQERVSIVPETVTSGRKGGWETIILVEDETAVRVMTKRMLERAGYKVIEAHHGNEALKLFSEHEGAIHLLLTDIVMPEMGGFELVGRLTKMHPDIRVLLMSGYSDEAAANIGEEFLNVVFLKKPFTFDELTGKVRLAIDGDPPSLQ